MEEEREPVWVPGIYVQQPIKLNSESIMLKVRGDMWFEALGIKSSLAWDSMHAESYTVEFILKVIFQGKLLCRYCFIHFSYCFIHNFKTLRPY